MKKIIMLMSVVVSMFAYDKILSQSKIQEVISKTPLYSEVKKNKNLKLKGVEKKDFYIITLSGKLGSADFFVTKDFKYTILGNVIDNTTKAPLQPNYPPRKFHGDKKVVKDGVLFTFGSGKKDLYVVTDPECPWCRKFAQQSKKANLSKKYKIHILFLPIHKDSMNMIYYILSAPTQQEKAKRFSEVLKGSDKWKDFKPSKQQKETIDKLIKKSTKAVFELKAQGTPSFYDKDLNEIKDWSKILQ